MSARIFGGKAALSGSPQNITALVASVQTGFTDTVFSVVAIRAALDNAGEIHIGRADVDNTTRSCGILQPGEELTIDLLSSVHTDNFFLIGTFDDHVHILGVEY